MKPIRNFCIIAHIDHGKSSLADRLIEVTKTVEKREMKAQLLDSMDLERERGITIKLQAVRMQYEAKDAQDYSLNLIDTPGHVDFSYEVSRSLAACEGALLLVDATQGIEAQTLANMYLALEHNLELIPVINKIDLPAAEPAKIAADIEHMLGLSKEECVFCSAKTGEGVEAILEAVVKRIPAPKQSSQEVLRALIFDAHFDVYRGIIAYVRIVDGQLKRGDKVMMMSEKRPFEVLEVGVFKPKMQVQDVLSSGEVGYVISNIKKVEEARVGDTLTFAKMPACDALPGYQEAKPMVFCGLYPVDNNDYEDLKAALEKLKLNDAALQFMPESSHALGFGYRCGFLGLLHMEIVQERLEREFDLDIVLTAPQVPYKCVLTSGEELEVETPSQFPDRVKLSESSEPVMAVSIMSPTRYMGAIMDLVSEHRGVYKKAEVVDELRQNFYFEVPLSELMSQFFNQLKSKTQGYASMDYSFERYQVAKLVKVDMLINGESVDALSFVAAVEKADYIARRMAEKLKELIPRQLYEVAIQGCIGGKIICRESIGALRKNVTAKCYGGDISRKRKLLEKQKAGKKKMKAIGSINVPKEAFLSVLKLDE